MEIHNCKYCNIINAEPDFTLFSDDEVNRILNDIYTGRITIESLDVAQYQKVAAKLTSGVYDGYGSNLIGLAYNTPDYVMLTSLRENVYVFSAAKSYQQCREISALLIDENGNRRNFYEFRKEASKVFDKYNKNYLYAEYNNAIATARAASLWQDIELDKSTYNQLRYDTVGDGRVRPDHKVLDGITKPVDSTFWKTNYPPLGWNCRCTVIQTFDETITTLTKPQQKAIDDVPEIFRFNAGKEKIIFSPAHPYFEVARADRELAKNNFNLPLPTNA